MKVGIPLSTSAYTPEAYAYEKYLKAMGHEVQLDYDLDPNNDINIHFMGTRPFWKSSKGRALEIHEYQSLSTPPYAKLKNYSKRIINKKPVGRIFLNILSIRIYILMTIFHIFIGIWEWIKPYFKITAKSSI
jgi:hypothetical protein